MAKATIIPDEEFVVTEDFSALLEETLGDNGFEGRVIKGTVLDVLSDVVIVDVTRARHRTTKISWTDHRHLIGL